MLDTVAIPAHDAPAVSAPYKVDVSRGRSDGSLIEGVRLAKEAVVAKEQEDALKFLRERGGFSAKRAKDIARLDSESGAPREEGDFPRSVWDFSQAITAFARTIPNSDDRLAVEAVAGKLLDKVA